MARSDLESGSGLRALPLVLASSAFENERDLTKSDRLVLVIHRGAGDLRSVQRLIDKNKGSHGRYCVFNKTRESFLSLSVVAADTHFARLKGLVGRFRLKSDEGIWVIPSQGVHSIGLLFAIDLIYLDAEYRVVQLVESFGTFRIGPIKKNCASVLELPTRTIYSSQTQVGDELLICSPEEMEAYLKENDTNGQVKTLPS